jgi:hypothetical protein
MQAIIDKLESLGFKSGYYGEAKYKLIACEAHSPGARVVIVVLDDRQLGTISVTAQGTWMIDLDFAKWLRSKVPPSFVIGMDLATKSDRIVCYNYSDKDVEVTVQMIKNRWGPV